MQGAPLQVPTFAYAGAPRGQNYEMWREEFCRRFCQLDADPGDSDDIECTVEVARVGALSFGAAHGTSGSFLRTRSLLSDGCDDFVLVTAVGGEVLTVQHGRTVELRQGEMCLMSLDDIAECGFAHGASFTALRVPRRQLMAVCREAEDSLSRTLPDNSGLRDVVSGYFDLCAQTATALDAVSQDAMARHMTELVALLLGQRPDGSSDELRQGYRGARLQLVESQTLERLGDDHLTIDFIARQAGLTPKQVQRLFASKGTTFSEFVLEHRLLLAQRLLTARTSPREKISAVAANAGFGDLSYFNRSFRRRFGLTPSDWRESQATDA